MNYTIADYWDTDGIITAESDARVEYIRWRDHASENHKVWRGDEFTIEDFHDYIIGLIENEIR